MNNREAPNAKPRAAKKFRFMTPDDDNQRVIFAPFISHTFVTISLLHSVSNYIFFSHKGGIKFQQEFVGRRQLPSLKEASYPLR